jgi:hypothetical protein
LNVPLPVAYTKQVREKLVSFGDQGKHAIGRVERELLLKVVRDFKDQINADEERVSRLASTSAH